MVGRLFSWIVVSLTLIALGSWAGCGGGSPGGGADGGDTNGPLTATIQAADAVTDSFHQACDAAAWPAGADAFVASVRTHPEVASASVDATTGDACVHYRSGVAHVLHHCEQGVAEPPASLDALLAGAGVSASEAGSRQASPRWFPSQDSPAATAATSKRPDEWRGLIRDACRRILDSCHVSGYATPSAIPDASIDWFRSWGQYGVIFVDAHGGWGNWHTDEGEVPLFAMQTDYQYSLADGPGTTYAEDLYEGRLVFFSLDTDDAVEDARALAVTSRFFEHYCNPLASHSIIWLNSCNCLTYLTDLATTLTGLGAEAVIGWRGFAQVGHGTAWAVWAFDRMGGLNVTHPLDPPTRPFTADDVWQELNRRGWTHFVTSDGAVCDLDYYRPTSADDERTALRPVISGGVFHPETESSRANVWLNGYFGRPRGQILVDETPLAISVWEPFYIQGDFPRGTTDLVGDVYVRVNHLESNPVPLTHFSGGFDVDVERPGRYDGTIQGVFDGRVLLHQIRADIDGTPVTMPTPSGYALFQPEHWEITWNIGGEWDVAESGEVVHYSLDARGSADRGSDSDALIQAFQLDLDANTVRRRATIDVDGTLTRTDSDGTTTSHWSASYGTAGLLSAETLPANWDIPARSFSRVDDGTTITIHWTHIAPDNPPPTGAPAYPSSIRGARMLGKPG